ncbi:MAG: M1 family metallopeptidase [Ferruginibacter sp.]
MKFFTTVIVCLFISISIFAQADRWQQRVNYKMDIDMDVTKNTFSGKQQLIYTNNSPDKLTKLFYHLYWNAFQPGSSMDVRSQYLGKTLINKRADWDSRVKDRIANLTPKEIGSQKIISIKMNGISQPFIYHETILEVQLTQPIMPHTKVTLDMLFEAQVPLQVRRSGRDNPTTKVRYSMSQWYPKLCEYDYEGWHPTPYIAREFYGVWGDYDVNIRIDKNYKIGGTGTLQNASAIGWGYDKPGTSLKPTDTDKRSWHFTGQNIHDFVWAADPEYLHTSRTIKDGLIIHVIYKASSAREDSAWQKIADASVKVLPYIEKHFGKYPYPQYSFILGGDGGMEYPMATLISSASMGTAFHEWMHSWYQMMMGTNEGLYPWMDEGFASFAEELVTSFYNNNSALLRFKASLKRNLSDADIEVATANLPDEHTGSYDSYFDLVKSGLEEPMTTHADHYNTNYAYGLAAYSKGEVFLEQLGYVTGAKVRDSILIEYYKHWRFKHPNANDFMKIAQDVSGMQLDWYKQYWINGTKTIDYGIDSLWEEKGVSKIRLRRVGLMPMPVDLKLTFKDGSTELHSIPLNLMFGNKPDEKLADKFIVDEEWRWTHTTYVVQVNRRLADLKIAEIDPTKRMADTERKNNKLELNW